MEKQVRIGVGVLILKDGKALLGKRHAEYSNASHKLSDSGGTWTCPGGGIDFGETLRECAIREVKEETNLDIKNPEFLSLRDDMSEQAQYVTINFIATEFDGEVENMEPHKIDEWRWFDLDDVPENLFGPTKGTLSSYKNNQTYND
jgi:8-oxo-dGTP diphosphatase